MRLRRSMHSLRSHISLADDTIRAAFMSQLTRGSKIASRPFGARLARRKVDCRFRECSWTILPMIFFERCLKTFVAACRYKSLRYKIEKIHQPKTSTRSKSQIKSLKLRQFPWHISPATVPAQTELPAISIDTVSCSQLRSRPISPSSTRPPTA